MSKSSLLAFAGIYRAKLSDNSDSIFADLEPIEELISDDLKGEHSFLENQKGLGVILKSFAGSFIRDEEQLLNSLKYYNELKAKMRKSLSSEFQCATAEDLSRKEYPLTVTSGNTLDKKAVLPLSPHGLFIQFPTASFVSFCRDRIENNVTGEVECPPIGPCPFVDDVYYSFCLDTVPFSSRDCSQLYGFSIILNSHAFSQPSSDRGNPCRSHVVLCMLSYLPEFLFVKQIVINTAYVLCEAVSDNWAHRRNQDVDELLRKRFHCLSTLVSKNANASEIFPGNSISIPLFPPSQFLDLQRSGAMLFQMINTPFSTLLLSFSEDAIRLLHTLLLCEARIIFLGCSPQHASACAVSAPSFVSPMKWVAPLIPYLPVDGIESSGLLEAIFSPSVGHENSFERRKGDVVSSKCAEANGFIIGSMPNLIPTLILRWSALAGAYGGASACSQIWVADARTGHIGVLPIVDPRKSTTLSSFCDNFSVLPLVPASNKLQKKISAAIKDSQRYDFRLIMSYFSHLRKSAEQIKVHNSFMKRLLNEGKDESDFPNSFNIKHPIVSEGKNVYMFPNISESLIAEVHAALLEFNTHRICGEYRKGLEMPRSGSIYQFSFNVLSFLEPQLHCGELAQSIERTHMFKQFFGAILNFEVHMVGSVLTGAKMCPNSSPGSKGSGSSAWKLPLHPWGLSPVFQAELCLFYSRARNRFPELFSDFSGVNLSNYCMKRVYAQLFSSETDLPEYVLSERKNTAIMPTIVSLAGTVSDGSPESKGSMQKWFSKASKAVKKLQNGETHFVFAIPFLQGLISYGYFPPSSTFSKFVNSVPPLENYGKGYSPNSSSSISSSSLLEVEFKFSEILSKKPQDCSKKKARGSVCGRLPLDMIQNFLPYHSLLDPFHENPYTTSNSLEEVRLLLSPQKVPDDQREQRYKRLWDFSLLFPFSQRLWEAINDLRSSITCSSAPVCSQSPSFTFLTPKLNQDSQESRSSSLSKRKQQSSVSVPIQDSCNQDYTTSLPVCAGSASPVMSVPLVRPSLSDLFDDLPGGNISGDQNTIDDMMLDGFSSGVPVEFSADSPGREIPSFISTNTFSVTNSEDHYADPNKII